MVNKEDFSKWLLEEIEARKMSYSEVARLGGISHARISQVIAGEPPGVDFCNGIAKAFGVSSILVLEKAGKIPPLDDADLSFRELWHHVRKLSHRDRVRLIQIAREWSREEENTEEQEE